MVSPVKRRSSSSTRAKQLISAIVYVRQQKQIPNLKRISSYMLREHDVTETETQKQLHLAVKDGLIISYTAIGSKGSKTGIEQEGFKIPQLEDTELDDGHDWYCFECHKSGEILECEECWRVFHTDCVDNETDGSSFVCYICKSGKTKNQLKRKMLNTLLSYTVMRLKEKTRELHKIGFREENHDLIFDRFIYKTMDLNMMEQKVSRHKYKCLEQFQADAQTILHAVHILYGDEKGGITELSRIMVHDCKYDLDEIRQCHRCYYLSNAKPQHWFCQPCDPPHELVYAKQKGYSYWPAKIIRNYGDKCDVRFFGAFHQRAVIPMEYIRPVTANIKTLNIKKTTGFNNSMKELHIHQKLVEEIATDQKEKEEEESEKEEESSASEGEEDAVEALEEEEPMEVEEETDKQVSSTSVQPPRKKRKYSKKAASPESSLVVTSSEDQVAVTPPVAMSTTACQTVKLKVHSVHVQTDEVREERENGEILTNCKEGCNCKENKQALEDLRKTLLKEHSSEKEEALKELTEKLLKSFEEDKQQAVSRTMANTKTEIERIRKQTEEKCKEKFMEEMKKLATKHKEAISQTKKKQWCFNCEEEAMYHCCWNTSYCSVKCQQEHWHKDHKRICRRKR